MRRQIISLPYALGHLVLKESPWISPLLVLELGNIQDGKDLLGTGATALHQSPILDSLRARICRSLPMIQTTSA